MHQGVQEFLRSEARRSVDRVAFAGDIADTAAAVVVVEEGECYCMDGADRAGLYREEEQIQKCLKTRHRAETVPGVSLDFCFHQPSSLYQDLEVTKENNNCNSEKTDLMKFVFNQQQKTNKSSSKD